MANPAQIVFIDEEKRSLSTTSLKKNKGTGTVLETIDKSAEWAYGIVSLNSYRHKI